MSEVVVNEDGTWSAMYVGHRELSTLELSVLALIGIVVLAGLVWGVVALARLIRQANLEDRDGGA